MGKEINLDDILAANLAQLKKDGAFSTALGLAKDAHISSSTMGYILQTKPREKNNKGESGSCTLKSVASIAAALNLSPIELLTSQHDQRSALLAAFEDVPKELRESAVSVVRALSAKKTTETGPSNKVAVKTKAKQESEHKTKRLLVSNGD